MPLPKGKAMLIRIDESSKCQQTASCKREAAFEMEYFFSGARRMVCAEHRRPLQSDGWVVLESFKGAYLLPVRV